MGEQENPWKLRGKAILVLAVFLLLSWLPLFQGLWSAMREIRQEIRDKYDDWGDALLSAWIVLKKGRPATRADKWKGPEPGRGPDA